MTTIVVARIEQETIIVKEGQIDIGRPHVFGTRPKPVAMCWVNEGTDADLEKANAWAKREGYRGLRLSHDRVRPAQQGQRGRYEMRKLITAILVTALIVIVFRVSRWAGTLYYADCDKAAGRSILAWGRCLGVRQACETSDSRPCIDLQNVVCKGADKAHETMLRACEGREP